jgi:hypothetical protein
MLITMVIEFLGKYRPNQRNGFTSSTRTNVGYLTRPKRKGA